MTSNIASLYTEVGFDINGGTAAPSVWSEVFGGLCTNYVSAPVTNSAGGVTAATSTATSMITSTSEVCVLG